MAETGHARNVENFQQMIVYATGWGVDYNPEPARLRLPAMQAKLVESEATLDAVIVAVSGAKGVINDRENAFRGIAKFATRVISYLEASGAAANVVADARAIGRKIGGRRKKVLKDDPNTPEDETANAISVSQRSYSQQVEHFGELVALVGRVAEYNPNENALQVASLEAYVENLRSTNTAVMENLAAQSNARGARDRTMYDAGTGLVDVALAVKKYVAAAFGKDSMQYKQIRGLEFTRPKASYAVAV